VSRVAFVSYSRGDQPRVELVKNRLTQLGFEVWLDENLRGGQAWWDVILDKIRSCEVFVPNVSDASLQSQACAVERDYARALGKPVVPVAIERTHRPRPSDLETLQIVDYTTATDEAAFALVRAMNDHDPDRPLPGPLPARPEPPLSYLNRQMDIVTSRGALTHEQQVGVLLSVRPGLRSGDGDERLSAWTVLEALDARTDVTREVAEEIARLRAAHAPPEEQPQLRTESSRQEDEIAPRPAAPSIGQPSVTRLRLSTTDLVGAGTALGTGVVLALAVRWAAIVALRLSWEYGVPEWVYRVWEPLGEWPESFFYLLWLLTLGVMVYAGAARAKGRQPGSRSSWAGLAVGAAMRAVPLAVIWTTMVVVVEDEPVAWITSTMVLATTAGVVGRVLWDRSRDQGKTSEPGELMREDRDCGLVAS
jgi:hypothetical protein